jgi:hypothetical protein
MSRMLRTDLPVAGIVPERKFVAHSDIALERRTLRERAAESLGGEQLDALPVIAHHGGSVLLRAAVPGEGRQHAQVIGRIENHVALHPAHPVVRSVGREDLIAVHGGIEYRQLHVQPVLLIDRPVELQMMIEPTRLPADFLVLERIGAIIQGNLEARAV